MKIYVHDKGVILSGKAWEIRAKAKGIRERLSACFRLGGE